VVKSWLAQLPEKYHQRATCMFDRHGLLALLAGRFLAFVRTLLPTMAGISGLSSRRFQLFNWLSGLLWVGMITTLGYAISMIPFVKRHEDQVMTFLMILPLFLLVAGLVGTLAVVIKKNTAAPDTFPFSFSQKEKENQPLHHTNTRRIFPRRDAKIAFKLAAELRRAFITHTNGRSAGFHTIMDHHHRALCRR
jgi:hypothetical protein